MNIDETLRFTSSIHANILLGFELGRSHDFATHLACYPILAHATRRIVPLHSISDIAIVPWIEKLLLKQQI